MTLQLYFHPFASFCQKALTALYEKEVAFEPHEVNLGDPASRSEFFAIWPIGRFPVLRDRGRTIAESSIIVEYADRLGCGGPQLIPADPDAALEVRQWDRVIDNYIHVPMQKIVGDRLRPEERRDPQGVEEARATIETAFALLEGRLDADGWFMGEAFTLADCAAAPPLFYCEKLAGFSIRYPKLGGYLGRLLQRPSFRRVVDEARHFRPFFPGAAEDGDWPKD